MFKRILIANRGEISCRIIKTARRMGVATVAVFSEADRDALHVEMADMAVPIGPPPAAQSYLVIEKIVAACKETGAEAVHPGYGFLSENEAFAKKVEDEGIIFTTLDKAVNWARKSSIWPLGFGLACCAIEMMSMAAARFDLARFGAEVFRPSPRQADLMIVSGTVTKKMVPQIVRLFNQMPQPRYVISMGACATGGGPFKEGYNVVSGIDKFLPVDVYIPGCPPRPEALLHGFIKLQEKIEKQSVRTVAWYNQITPPSG